MDKFDCYQRSESYDKEKEYNILMIENKELKEINAKFNDKKDEMEKILKTLNFTSENVYLNLFFKEDSKGFLTVS